MPERRVASRRYLAVLAIISVTILVAGIAFRPARVPLPTISEAERFRLQLLAEKQELRQQGQFFLTHARELAPQLNRVRQTSDGVPSVAPPPGELLLLVAPGRAGEPHWVTGNYAGTVARRCDGQDAQELSTNIEIPPTLESGAAFDLDGNLAGIVEVCNGAHVLLTPESFHQLSSTRIDRALIACCGLRVAPQPSGGLLVTELRVQSYLARAGLQAGDLIVSVDGQPATSLDHLRALADGKRPELVVQRGKTALTIAFDAPASARTAWRQTASGVELTAVAAGSPAARSGLRPGDIVVRVGETRRLTPATIARALARAASGDIVVIRGDRQFVLHQAQ